jgi:hypothetical protein
MARHHLLAIAPICTIIVAGHRSVRAHGTHMSARGTRLLERHARDRTTHARRRPSAALSRSRVTGRKQRLS